MVKVFVKTFLSNVEEKLETVGQGSKRLELELKYHPMLFRTTYMKGIPHKAGTVVNVHCMFRSHAGHRSVLYLDTFYGVWLWASKLELLVFHLSPRQDRTFLFSWKKKTINMWFLKSLLYFVASSWLLARYYNVHLLSVCHFTAKTVCIGRTKTTLGASLRLKNGYSLLRGTLV